MPGSRGEHIISGKRTATTLERKLSDRLDRDSVFDLQQHARTDQDLPGLGFGAQPRATLDKVPIAA